MIGGGSENNNYDVGKNVVLPYLLDRRIKCLDYVIISHFDSDHVKGLFVVFQNIKVKNVIIAKQYESTENYERFLDIINKERCNVILAKKGDIIQIDNKSRLEILFPFVSRNDYIKENAINNNSIVFKYIDRNVSVLYTGDIEKLAEESLIKEYGGTNQLAANILKVSHHGSKTSTTEKILDLVNPKIAVISVGRNNTFGHPNIEVLQRLVARGIRVRRTDMEGEVFFIIREGLFL